MNTSGKFKVKILSTTIFMALLFLFVTLAAANVSAAPIRVRAGGPGYTDSVGQVWSSDFGYFGGRTDRFKSAVANTNDPTLYRTERWGTFSYNFSVPSGTYSVTLKFAELYFKVAGKRIFGVDINGVTVLSNFDIIAQAGGANIAVDKTFTVNSTGKIKIQFVVGTADLPKVDAIQIVPSSASSTTGTTDVAPAILTQPSSTSIISGQTATFNVAATGTAPMKFQWRKNGTAVSGATSSSYTTPAETTSDNNAQFSVAVTNSVGVATSNAAILTVNAAAAIAPAITTQPASKTITAGQTATFSVAATGTSPMTFQWKKNGTAVSGATSSSYTTPAETTSDNNSQFTVAVSNSAGSATSNAAILTVNAAAAVAPAITTQPASKTITAGQTATFSVVTTGTSPMTYQWKKNGTAVSGATSSSYTTPSETTADTNAQFSVTVSNSAGNVTSNSATLTVNAATLVLNTSASALNFGNVNVSSSSSQNVTLTNAGTSSITISNVSVSGAGFGASGVSTGLILNPGQTATLTATFSPSATGSVTGSVTVASDASTSPSITLSGTGVNVVKHSVVLSWIPSTSTVASYNTYTGTKSGGPYTKLASAPSGTTSYTDSTVQAATTYFYVVTAVDSNNVESVSSNEITATIP